MLLAFSWLTFINLKIQVSFADYEFITDPQKWLEEYHPRSIAESGNSVIKRRFPINLLKKDDTRIKAEAFSRACIYNLRQLNYIHYLCPEIDVYWLK